jgi:hypothetical protein
MKEISRFLKSREKGSIFILAVFFIILTAVSTAALLKYSMQSSIVLEKGQGSVRAFHISNLAFDIYQNELQMNATPGLTDAEKLALRNHISTAFFGASGSIAELQDYDVNFQDTTTAGGDVAVQPTDPNDFWSFRSSKNLQVTATIR